MRQARGGSGESWRTAAAALALACGATDATRVEPDEPRPAAAEDACLDRRAPDLRRDSAALSVVDRSLVGDPASYVADPSLRVREPELMRSQRARRAAAWEVAARVLAPVALPADLGLPGPTLRAWQTWHNEDDLTRIFRRLYAQLTPEERARRAPFSADAITEAGRWNDGAVSDFEAWSVERLAEYRRAIDSAAEVAGVGGIARVAHAPATSQHWLESYAEVLECRRSDAPPEPEGVPMDAGSPCDDEPTFEPACLAGQFDPASVLVKASWTRLDAGGTVHAFDTSAASLADKLSSAQGFDWGPGDRAVSPGEDEMYTLQLPNGNRFGLTGLHIMSKELEHWFWVTLWWSDDPDSDFGEDRPDGIGAPFDHYKLCSVVWFDEADDSADGGFASDAPSLAAALASTASGPGGPTWCSNPYIERGAGNAATNCIGCHQHAGTTLSSEEVLAAHDPASGTGRRQSRSSFPADYVFALRRGDDIGAMFVETEDHSAASPLAP